MQIIIQFKNLTGPVAASTRRALALGGAEVGTGRLLATPAPPRAATVPPALTAAGLLKIVYLMILKTSVIYENHLGTSSMCSSPTVVHKASIRERALLICGRSRGGAGALRNRTNTQWV